MSVKNPCFSFMLKNPAEIPGNDIPQLLRHLAKTLEANGITSESILDINLGAETFDLDADWVARVYFDARD